MDHIDLRLGQIVFISVFCNISFSWLFPLDGFQFIFLYRVYCVTGKTIFYAKIWNVLPSIYQAGRARVRARIVDAVDKVRYLTSLKWRAIPIQRTCRVYFVAFFFS